MYPGCSLTNRILSAVFNTTTGGGAGGGGVDTGFFLQDAIAAITTNKTSFNFFIF